jgi:hypothetical protein
MTPIQSSPCTLIRINQADPFVERVADKMRTLAAVKPALVRLLEWQIDQELERAASRPSRGLKR